MQYLIVPILIVSIASIAVLVLIAQNKPLRSTRLGFALLLLLVSHSVVGLAVWIGKSFDDNSYYAFSMQTFLNETITAIEQKEPRFLNRLKQFASEQHLTYENRDNLLDHVRSFETEGKKIRSEIAPK